LCRANRQNPEGYCRQQSRPLNLVASNPLDIHTLSGPERALEQVDQVLRRITVGDKVYGIRRDVVLVLVCVVVLEASSGRVTSDRAAGSPSTLPR